MKIGICSSSGRQEAAGLTPSSLYSFMTSWPYRSRSEPYFSWRARAFGATSCMDRELLICRTNSGIISVRTTTVSETMARTHVQPEFGSMTMDHRLWAPTRMPDITQ